MSRHKKNMRYKEETTHNNNKKTKKKLKKQLQIMALVLCTKPGNFHCDSHQKQRQLSFPGHCQSQSQSQASPGPGPGPGPSRSRRPLNHAQSCIVAPREVEVAFPQMNGDTLVSGMHSFCHDNCHRGGGRNRRRARESRRHGGKNVNCKRKRLPRSVSGYASN
ncbi:uncharacterized protein Dvir_GJ27114 [Drosophila virilis]|uniref:Uncharacterized protein n=1 Tax=Drosophila virilis TaxID=7244 RepID=A0A0Q9WEC7_DROVI|nr:uncharacterized protein Dvir_GJ27114 [Drosophila virilis]